RPLSLRTAALEARVTNPGRGLRVQAVFGAGGAIAGEFGADTVSGVAIATIADGTVTGGTARLDGVRLGWGAATFEALETAAAYDSATGAQFTALARRDDTHELYVAGVADPEASTARLDSLRISLPDEEWNLLQPATLSWAGPFTPGGLTLAAGASRIALSGAIDPDDTQDLGVELRAVRIDGFADLLGFEGVRGQIDGLLDVSGPAEDVTLEGSLAVALEGVRLEAGIEPAPAGHTVSARLDDLEGGFLAVEGTVPLEISVAEDAAEAPADTGGADLAVTGRDFRVAWATPLVARFGVDQLGGLLNADARIQGLLSEPRLGGTATLSQGVLRIPEQGVAYREIAGSFGFEGERILVDSLRAVANGTATIRG